MVDFAAARRAMVDSQVNTSAVNDLRLLKAMGTLPRERFVPAVRRDIAYIDDHQPLGNGRHMLAPATFARLVQLADIKDSDRALEVDAATGYGVAVIAAMAKHVVGLESDPDLAAAARATLPTLDIANAEIVEGNWSSLGDRHFDAIVVEGPLNGQPDDLLARLEPGGRLVALVRRGRVGVATRYIRSTGGIISETHFDAPLPPSRAATDTNVFIF